MVKLCKVVTAKYNLPLKKNYKAFVSASPMATNAQRVFLFNWE